MTLANIHARDWQPLVTVVTPSYNQGHFIERTIQSVLAQTHPAVEYIVLDAESTDGTREVLERYRGDIDVLRIEPDDGQTDAINKGFRIARGELVGWVNSDDMLTPEAVASAVEAYRRHGDASLVYGDMLLVGTEDEVMGHLRPPPHFTFDDMLNGRFDGVKRFITQPGSFYRNEMVQRVGGLRNEFHLLMDKDLWLRLLRHGDAYHTGQTVAHFRKHEAAKTDRITWRFVKERHRLRREFKARLFGPDTLAHARVVARCLRDDARARMLALKLG